VTSSEDQHTAMRLSAPVYITAVLTTPIRRVRHNVKVSVGFCSTMCISHLYNTFSHIDDVTVATRCTVGDPRRNG